MTTTETLFNERMGRLKKAIALEKPDRTPIMLAGAFFLKYGEPTACLADFVNRRDWADDMVMKGYEKLPAIDAGGPPVRGNVESAGAVWLSKTRIPGRDLPDDVLWQIDEVGLMTEEDYDTILNIGWKKFLADFLVSRLGYTPEQLEPDPELLRNWTGGSSRLDWLTLKMASPEVCRMMPSVPAGGWPNSRATYIRNPIK